MARPEAELLQRQFQRVRPGSPEPGSDNLERHVYLSVFRVADKYAAHHRARRILRR
jgi:hypothetical protein